MLKDDNEIKDVAWKEVDINEKDDNNIGKINFRRNKNKARMAGALKFLLMLVVASASGAVTATYIVNTKSSELAAKNNTPIFQKKKVVSDNTNYEIPANSINKVAEDVGPAIVCITNSADDSSGKDEKQNIASGIIFKSDGSIITNYHVIEGAKKITVKLSNGKNGKVFNAKLIGYDVPTDLAIIKIDAKNLPTVTFGDSSKLRTGDVAIAIGNTLGDEFKETVTAGIVSATNMSVSVPDNDTGEPVKYNIIQTDATINFGNSGGALCNEKGEVIGINSLKISPEHSSDGIGFAISINEVKQIIDQLIKNGKVIRPFLGVVVGTSIPDKNNGISGAYIKEVLPNGGAEKAGIKPTDIIVELDGIKVVNSDDIRDILYSKKIGDKIPCKVYREGKYKKLQIVLSQNNE
ncbi:S1C family serine protease [Clostridium hydrogenum]|uniref:S1C family serine protease n=1 Tax=Clostridium hydrogenum TaxID=2855764 RepID=UPI001F18DF06